MMSYRSAHKQTALITMTHVFAALCIAVYVFTCETMRLQMALVTNSRTQCTLQQPTRITNPDLRLLVIEVRGCVCKGLCYAGPECFRSRGGKGKCTKQCYHVYVHSKLLEGSFDFFFTFTSGLL